MSKTCWLKKYFFLTIINVGPYILPLTPVCSQSSLQSQEIVSELVYSFLIPEIEKIRVRQRGW